MLCAIAAPGILEGILSSRSLPDCLSTQHQSELFGTSQASAKLISAFTVSCKSNR